MRTTINDPRLLDLTHTQAELSLLFIHDDENEHFDRVESMLGILWTRDEVAGMFGGEVGDQQLQQIEKLDIKRARYPLALILRPDLFTELKERFGLGTGEKNEKGMPGMPHIPQNAQSLGMLDKDSFLNKLGFKSYTDDAAGSPNHRDVQTGFTPTTPRRLGGR